MNDMFRAYNNLYTPAERKELIAMSLKTYREMHKKSQKEIAEAIGLNQQTYAAYERGRNEPPAEILVRLSLYYDIPLDLLMQRDNMSKDKLTVKKQLEMYEDSLQEISDKLFSGDEKTTEQFKTLLDGMGQLTELVKALKDVTGNQ